MFRELVAPIIENRMNKKMRNETETGIVKWFMRIGGFPQIRVLGIPKTRIVLF